MSDLGQSSREKKQPFVKAQCTSHVQNCSYGIGDWECSKKKRMTRAGETCKVRAMKHGEKSMDGKEKKCVRENERKTFVDTGKIWN